MERAAFAVPRLDLERLAPEQAEEELETVNCVAAELQVGLRAGNLQQSGDIQFEELLRTRALGALSCSIARRR